jgi:alpha-beta hydrolase superfamily lysophospholipase
MTNWQDFSNRNMKKENTTFVGADGKLSLIDLTIPESFSGKLVVFIHGFMGFKDWGAWNLVQDYFLSLGFGFCKYNVSHNGCSTEDGVNFIDLVAFGKNNYSNEKADLSCALDWISEQLKPLPEIYVIGHSRGGGIVLLSHEDSRIKKVVTWAAISDVERRFPKGDELEKWKKEGVRIQKNGRTNQEMPMYYSLYEDFIENKEVLNIQKAAESISKPLLLIHGNDDTSVAITEGEELSKWSGVPLQIISGANHTFGSSHPWKELDLPPKLKEVCKLTAEFFLRSRL